MKENIRNEVLKFGADVCGFANIDRFSQAPKGFHPADIYKECKSVVVFGVSLPKGLSHVDPRLIYGHYNYLTCSEIDRIALRTAKIIENTYQAVAVPMPCDGPYEFWDETNLEGRGLLSMKHAAVLAGLGSLGKNTLLLNEKYGNMLVIGAILTNLELESDELSKEICIKSCSLCIMNCPTQALNGEHVKQKGCRLHAYGKTKRGFDTVDCNKCRSVCPRRFGILQ